MKRLSFVLLFVLSGCLAVAHAEPPSWWTSGTAPVLDVSGTASNYAPANLGQLKHMAKRAKAYLDTGLFIGSGTVIPDLVGHFEPRSGQGYSQAQIDAFRAENYAPINLGQLKAVAKPFYQQLLAAGYDTKANLIVRGYPSTWAYNYPWNPETAVADNYAPANLGQLKMVFSFDLTGFDTDLDGLPDAWEISRFGNTTSQSGGGDKDGDGLTNLQEFQQSSDPEDYYNGTVPTLQKLSGDSQTGESGGVLASPLVVKVLASGSVPQVAAPVSFSISGSYGQIASSGTGTFGSNVDVTTGTAGTAAVYLKLSGSVGALNQVQAQVISGTANTAVTFSATTKIIFTEGLNIVGGNNQAGRANEFLANPLTVEMRSGTAGTLQINAPVTYAVTSGSGKLATQFGGTTVSGTLALVTGSDGRAQAYFQQATDQSSTISVSSGTSVVTFASSLAGGGAWNAWSFDEGFGVTAQETTGLGVDGTLTNEPEWSEGFDGRGSVELAEAIPI